MKILGITFGYIAAIATVITGVECWEDHPDIEDHKETDRIYKAAQRQTGADEYECLEIEKQRQEDLKNYKRSKFWKAKDVEDSM